MGGIQEHVKWPLVEKMDAIDELYSPFHPEILCIILMIISYDVELTCCIWGHDVLEENMYTFCTSF